jgi:hypothetical protein
MKPIYALSLLLLISFTACNDSGRNLSDEADDDLNTARTFIRSALDGDFNKAKTYIVDDSLNHQDLDAYERLYREKMSPEDKRKYREASIRIHEKKDIDSLTSIVYYSNTYRNQKDSLKVIKTDGKWLVDFKYIFKHKTDSLP